MSAYFLFQKRLFLGILLSATPLCLLAWYLSHAFAEAFLLGLAAALLSLLLKFRLVRQTLKALPSTVPWYTLLSMTLYVGALYGGYKVHARHLLGLAGVSSAIVLVIFILFIFGLTEFDLRGTPLHSSVVQNPDGKELS
ncbi:MAG: hypothetical protein GX130_11810 [Candidatus Hydrogenedens sp.]|jgi:hypothetical protein|nr:hypothetical protein [Candidatus Hydrogenedens sp.]